MPSPLDYLLTRRASRKKTRINSDSNDQLRPLIKAAENTHVKASQASLY
jgi:hypothetical protein